MPRPKKITFSPTEVASALVKAEFVPPDEIAAVVEGFGGVSPLQMSVEEYLPKRQGLNPKQEAYVRAVACGMTASEAMSMIGLTRNECSTVEVKRAIGEAVGERNRALGLQAVGIVRQLVRLALAAEAAGDYVAATKGWELIGRHTGAFDPSRQTDRKEVKITYVRDWRGHNRGTVAVEETHTVTTEVPNA